VSDRQVVALAVATALGAFIAHRVPAPLFVIALGVVVAGFAVHRPLLVIVGTAVVASALAANALAGLAPPRPTAVSGQWVTLLTDPAPFSGGSIGADIRIGRRHAQAFARGPAASVMATRLAGEKLRIDGSLRPLTGEHDEWLIPRHISARVTIDAVTGVRQPNFVGASANAFRRVVADGARVLPERLQPLFGGMVLGDDRGQSTELQDAFRAAGLTHLMVVSGQNVAFALLVASPLIRRGRLWWRFGATLLVLFGFGVLTRWEPSVLRAEAMAAVAAAGALVGRPVPALRLLALAGTACVLLDPLLVRSVGFRLSVAACAGLVLLTRPLHQRRVPMLLAASIAAQVGAAVVLVPTFGSVPLVSLPANVLAVPVAGPLMMWGLTAGPVAGLVPALAGVVHLPTRLALSWVAGVATSVSRIPLAPIGQTAAVGLLVAVLFIVVTRRHRVAFSVLVGVAVVALSLRAPSPTVAADLDDGATLWVIDGRSVLSVGGRVSPRLLDALRLRRVLRLDVLVVTRPGPAAAEAAWPVISAFRPRVVLAPEHHQVAGAKTARRGAVAALGAVEVRVTEAGPPLRFEVGRVVG
jgi:competence protein ComEC